jgi:hypothetical protein
MEEDADHKKNQESGSNQRVIFLSINPFLKMVIPPPL